jgi:hypothetical protein
MPQLNDDAFYLGQIQVQFTDAWAESNQGQSTAVVVVIGWQFTVDSSETFTGYNPSAGLVPVGFELQGINFLPPEEVTITQINALGIAAPGMTTSLQISGVNSSESSQSVAISTIYTTVQA